MSRRHFDDNSNCPCQDFKDRYHDNCFDRHFFDNCCRREFFHDDFFHHGFCRCRRFICDPCSFIRCSPFQLRLAGIQGNLSFLFFRFRGCRATIHFECGSNSENITGRICNAGRESVDIVTDSDKECRRVVTIMINRICKVEWLDQNCNPCRRCRFCGRLDCCGECRCFDNCECSDMKEC